MKLPTIQLKVHKWSIYHASEWKLFNHSVTKEFQV